MTEIAGRSPLTLQKPLPGGALEVTIAPCKKGAPYDMVIVALRHRQDEDPGCEYVLTAYLSDLICLGVRGRLPGWAGPDDQPFSGLIRPGTADGTPGLRLCVQGSSFPGAELDLDDITAIAEHFGAQRVLTTSLCSRMIIEADDAEFADMMIRLRRAGILTGEHIDEVIAGDLAHAEEDSPLHEDLVRFIQGLRRP